MDFYVLAKCISTEKGHVIIDLDSKTIKTYKPLYEVEEDHGYQIVDGNIQPLFQHQWNILRSYQLAFKKETDIHLNGFYFANIKEKDNIRIDHNGLLYKNELFLGRLTNEKELEFLRNEGVEKLKVKFDVAKKEGIKLLIKGKKIYRSFTRGKLNSLENTIQYEGNLFDLLPKVVSLTEEQLERKIQSIDSDLTQALQMIERARKDLEEVKSVYCRKKK